MFHESMNCQSYRPPHSGTMVKWPKMSGWANRTFCLSVVSSLTSAVTYKFIYILIFTNKLRASLKERLSTYGRISLPLLLSKLTKQAVIIAPRTSWQRQQSALWTLRMLWMPWMRSQEGDVKRKSIAGEMIRDEIISQAMTKLRTVVKIRTKQCSVIPRRLMY